MLLYAQLCRPRQCGLTGTHETAWMDCGLCFGMRLDDGNAVISVVVTADDTGAVVLLGKCADGTLLVVADLEDDTAALCKML